MPGLLGGSRRLQSQMSTTAPYAAVFHRLCPCRSPKGRDEGSTGCRSSQNRTRTAGTCLKERIPTARLPERGLRDSEDQRTPLCGHGIMWRGSGWPPDKRQSSVNGAGKCSLHAAPLLRKGEGEDAEGGLLSEAGASAQESEVKKAKKVKRPRLALSQPDCEAQINRNWYMVSKYPASDRQSQRRPKN